MSFLPQICLKMICVYVKHLSSFSKTGICKNELCLKKAEFSLGHLIVVTSRLETVRARWMLLLPVVGQVRLNF